MKKRSRPVQILLLLLGLVATGLGGLGVVLPVLPTTPFLLFAAFAFLHSAARLHKAPTEHRRFGPALQRIREGKGFSLKTKFISFTMAALVLSGFVGGADTANGGDRYHLPL